MHYMDDLRCFYLLLIVLLHLPPVQAFLGSNVAGALAQKFGTQVSIGKINLGFFNRIIIDDVMNARPERRQHDLCFARIGKGRLPAAEGWQDLGFICPALRAQANIYRQDAKSADEHPVRARFAGFEGYYPHKPLDLHIGSLIIRHGAVAYNQRDIAPEPGSFRLSTWHHRPLCPHRLGHLTDKDIHLSVKKIACTINQDFNSEICDSKSMPTSSKPCSETSSIELPHSQLQFDDLRATYRIREQAYRKAYTPV